jgi:hypothetical protein
MQIELPQDIVERIHRRFAVGAGATEVDIIRQALDSLDDMDQERQAIQEGIDAWRAGDTQDFADFELYCDWKIEKGGDSGIYLRGSPQVQIWDTAHPEYFRHGAEKGSGSLWNNKKNPNSSSRNR